MRVVAFGTTNTGEGYPRMDVLLDGLSRHDVHVERVLHPLFSGHAEKMKLASGGIASALNLMPRAFSTYSRLGRAYRRIPEPDVVLVGGLGHLDLLWLRCLSGGEHMPVVFDPFLSLYDTVVADRNLAGAGSIRARACLSLERQACLKADCILVDTDTMGLRLARTLDLPPGCIKRIYQGQDDRIFFPLEGVHPGSQPHAPVEVFFFGTYVPLQGVETILEAAASLSAETVRFTLVGDGQRAGEAMELARKLDLTNVEFERQWHTSSALAARMHRADICLGIFGTSDKAASVIPLKAVAALAMGRPLITQDSPAARELLVHGKNAWLVPPGDGEALAAAIRTLAASREFREEIGVQGRRLYLERMSPTALGRELKHVLESLVEERMRKVATV